MMIRHTIVLVVVLALFACSGCIQDKTVEQVPVNTVMNVTSVPGFIPSTTHTGQAGTIRVPDTIPDITGPDRHATLTTVMEGSREPGGYIRYTNADYSFDYPAGWYSNSTIHPLREYHHSQYDCLVTYTYNLDQELRMYYSPDGSTLFYSSVVKTERDIWPRTVQGRVVYEDIVNAVLGNPENCANYPDNKAFTIAGISPIPLAGVSYQGVRVDFARINLTGFTEGTGTAYIVTGKNHCGVFTFYNTSPDADTEAILSEYIFDSLHLDDRF